MSCTLSQPYIEVWERRGGAIRRCRSDCCRCPSAATLPERMSETSSVVEAQIDGGIREDLARSFSSAGVELHPKHSRACTSAQQLGEDPSPLRRGRKVSSPVNVPELFRFYRQHHAVPPRLHLLLVFTPRRTNGCPLVAVGKTPALKQTWPGLK